MAEDDLSEQLKEKLDAAAVLISESDDPEATLVLAYDYLDNEVNRAQARESDRMVLLSLFPDDTSPPEARANIKHQRGFDVEQTETPYDELPEEERMMIERVGAVISLPSFALLHVQEGSTKWCIYTAAGKICFKRPKN